MRGCVRVQRGKNGAERSKDKTRLPLIRLLAESFSQVFNPMYLSLVHCAGEQWPSFINAELFQSLLFLFPVRGNWDTKQHEAIYNSVLPEWMSATLPH